jgi:hypothetical protein
MSKQWEPLPVHAVETSAFFNQVPDAEITVRDQTLSLQLSIDGDSLVELTAYLPESGDGAELLRRITAAAAEPEE